MVGIALFGGEDTVLHIVCQVEIRWALGTSFLRSQIDLYLTGAPKPELTISKLRLSAVISLKS